MTVNPQNTVLIVEDEWLVRMDLADGFAQAGWNVLEGGSAEEGLEIFSEAAAVDLLVTDIRLSGVLTGWDLAKTAREAKPGLSVIYVSGNSIEEQRRVAGSVFLEKPARTERILQVAERLVKD